ncbi:hypothetical protein ECC02_010430 [Trypanosoma cruzi]|uniref:Mucin TcMUCII n=1 Tax=Trypanosoma cruzi TaxID=5693 RepID=A0A7J6XQK0_TRYCR|nr:hypothetical protein ECC02_010430 [Trypanosoma cruzi]
MHTDGQQHRARTNRAHSRRHVIIIVSVVVQWCGADLHSEGHGEQQGRREVRQTHTEGTPHEERAAARHAPYAAHHARHTLQSTAAGTHTHTQPCRNTNTQMEEGEANRSGTQGSTAFTYGEGGSSYLQPSWRVRTHTQERGCSANSKVKIKRRRSPHTTWIVGPREVQSIFITKPILLLLAFLHIQRTPLHASAATTAATAAHAKRKRSATNGINQAIIYLCFFLDVGRCLHAFCFCGG